MKELVLLGATGSIGTQTLDIVRLYQDRYSILAMSLGHIMEKNIEIINEFHPEMVAARTEEDALFLQEKYPSLIVSYGEMGLIEAATYKPSCKDVLLVVALVGSIGLRPTVSAIQIGRNIALANKETLVTAGEIVMNLARKNHVTVFPIDSEHSAIYQCLVGEKHEDIKRLIITASGGSFRDLTREELKNVTKEDALKHPNWSMGAKITIDSSTMMNKGFEVIEAHHLFDIPCDAIDTVLHRESIVHSLVEFKDSSIKAQIGVSDMRIPILYALSYPNRLPYNHSLDLFGKNLSFEPLSQDRFPCLAMAYEALKKGNIYPTVLNASNEAAVRLFLEDKISYLDIERIIREALDSYLPVEELTLDRILATDQEVKDTILKNYGGSKLC